MVAPAWGAGSKEKNLAGLAAMGDRALWLSLFDSQNGSQMTASSPDSPKGRKNLRQRSSGKAGFCVIRQCSSRVFSADFGESGATFQRAAVDYLDGFRLV